MIMIKKLLIITILITSNLLAMDNPLDRAAYSAKASKAGAAKEPEDNSKKVDKLTKEIQDNLRSEWTLFKTINLPRTYIALISNDRKFIVTATENDKDVFIWDTKNERIEKYIKLSKESEDRDIASMILSHDDKLLIIGDDLGVIYVFDLSNCQLIKKFVTTTEEIESLIIHDIKISKDNQIIFAISEDSIAICDIKTGNLLKKDISETPLSRLALSNNNSFLIIGDKNGNIHIYDIKTSKVVRTLEGHTDAIRALAINKDNTLLISGSSDKTVKIWDLKTYKLLNDLKYHNDAVTAVDISSNNQFIISGDKKGNIKIWDLLDKELKQAIQERKNEKGDLISRIIINHDNQLFMNVSHWDYTSINIWIKLSPDLKQFTSQPYDANESASDYVKAEFIPHVRPSSKNQIENKDEMKDRQEGSEEKKEN